MMDLLFLRFDAPMVSFGGVAVDNLGVVQAYPALSLLTGLCANALGYGHAEFQAHQDLQRRLSYSVRCDRKGDPLQDYQTVDLAQDFMVDTGWTTQGKPQGRKGGSSKDTHIRYMDYRADSIHSLALGLDLADHGPTLHDLECALREPARPLFLGRKCCLPAAPILLGRLQAEDLHAALVCMPLAAPTRRDRGPSYRAWWPEGHGAGQRGRRLMVSDARDWANSIHVGQRMVIEGEVTIREDCNA